MPGSVKIYVNGMVETKKMLSEHSLLCLEFCWVLFFVHHQNYMVSASLLVSISAASKTIIYVCINAKNRIGDSGRGSFWVITASSAPELRTINLAMC